MARYIHPEFGGFCLTTRFRRDIRLVAVSVLLGTMAGGIGAAIVGLNTSRSPATTSAHTALAISGAGISAAEGFSPRVNGIAQNSTTKAGAPTGGDPTPTFAAEISPGPKAACPGATPEDEQGCSFFKPQRVRARTLTEVPDLGRIAVGRVTPSTTIATQNSAAKLPEAKPMEEISASVAARADLQADQALSERPTVKKTQKTSRRARRNDRGMADPTSGNRADPWFARAENNAAPPRRPYAREASSARRGFWDWSW